jgi:hypothetical protein
MKRSTIPAQARSIDRPVCRRHKSSRRWILRTSAFRSSEKFALRVELLLYYRFGWLGRGYGIGVPMHYLPLTLFWPKDHRNPQIKRGYILTSADLGLGPLYLHYIGKLRSYMLPYYLDANELAISGLRCGTVRGLSNLIPPTHGRAKGVSEGYVVSTGLELFQRLGVPFEELIPP